MIIQNASTSSKNNHTSMSLITESNVQAPSRRNSALPEKSANKFLLFAIQNGGHPSKAMRIRFQELTDEEVSRLESVIADCMGQGVGGGEVVIVD